MARRDGRRLHLARFGLSGPRRECLQGRECPRGLEGWRHLWCSIYVALLLSGCLPPENAESPSSGAADVARSRDTAGDPTASSGSGREVDEGPHPLADDREPDPSGALPELSYQHLGMHIGGEPNDADSKKPWLDAIERGEEGLMRCYRLVDQPMKGGSVGVDLYVTTRGGSPEVRATRQKMGGDDFEACMKKAFEALSFHAPERPTVVSYSILFQME